MTRERNDSMAALEQIAQAIPVIYVRYAGRRFDIPLVGLDLSPASEDAEVKHVIALHLEVPAHRLDDCVIDRHSTGSLTLRPAVAADPWRYC